MSRLNTEAGNHNSIVHIYYDSNKTRETCVHIVYFIHSGVFVCLNKLFTGTRVFRKFQNFGYPVPEITENTHPHFQHIFSLTTHLNKLTLSHNYWFTYISLDSYKLHVAP